MSDDALEDVLQFSTDPWQALLSNNAILKESLECSICNSLMLEPYTLQCGHAFCGNCLLLWIRERQDQSTCPQCRSNILSEPVLSLGLRQIAVAVAQSWNLAGNTPQISDEELALKETPLFFPKGPSAFAIFDEEDGVFRCPHCSHEVDNDECTNCGRTFRNMASDRDYTSDDASSSDGSDDGDLVSFLDDDYAEEADGEDDPQAVWQAQRHNFTHIPGTRFSGSIAIRLGRNVHESRDGGGYRGHYEDEEDDSLDEFVANDEEVEEDDDIDDGTDDETENGDGDDDEMDLENVDPDLESEDSMLEEARQRTSRTNTSRTNTSRVNASSRAALVDDSDSEIEVVSVRHRPQVISDDE